MWFQKLRRMAKLWGDRNYELAEMLGVDNSTVGRWMAGRNEPPVSVAIKLAEHYGLTVEQLFKDGENLPNEVVRKIPQDGLDEVPADSAKKVVNRIKQGIHRGQSQGRPRKNERA